MKTELVKDFLQVIKSKITDNGLSRLITDVIEANDFQSVIDCITSNDDIITEIDDNALLEFVKQKYNRDNATVVSVENVKFKNINNTIELRVNKIKIRYYDASGDWSSSRHGNYTEERTIEDYDYHTINYDEYLKFISPVEECNIL